MRTIELKVYVKGGMYAIHKIGRNISHYQNFMEVNQKLIYPAFGYTFLPMQKLFFGIFFYMIFFCWPTLK